MKAPILIPRIDALDHDTFYREYVDKGIPVIIKGLVKDWPALNKWSHDYFLDVHGTDKVQAYQLNEKGECDIDMDRGSATQERILKDCIISMNNTEIAGKWTIASSVQLFTGALKGEYMPPQYCANGKFLRSMLFIGPKGVVSPLHQDLPENLYVMVKGTKRITLFAPLDHVYPNSRLSKLPNHSQIDAEVPDYTRFPKLSNAQPYIVDLTAGETLYIPSFWWHHLRNVEPSIAINFWWSQGWKLPIAWAAAMFKKWKGI